MLIMKKAIYDSQYDYIISIKYFTTLCSCACLSISTYIFLNVTIFKPNSGNFQKKINIKIYTGYSAGYAGSMHFSANPEQILDNNFSLLDR